MFKEWGFLITEMVWLLVLAALLGLLVGWIIWGRRKTETVVDTSAADALRGELAECRSTGADKDATIANLQAALEDARPTVAAPVAVVAEGAGDGGDGGDRDYDGDGVVEGKDEGTKPTTLAGPRDGGADDLKMIKGIGPKLEKLCNSLGFYHFDQIAAWSADEVAWVDANLEGFKGRVSRDEWVAQARTLASGGETEFSKRVEDGDVY